MQCLSLAGNDNDRGRESTGTSPGISPGILLSTTLHTVFIPIGNPPGQFLWILPPPCSKAWLVRANNKKEGLGAVQMLGRRIDRLRLGEKTRKETKNAEKLVFIDHCRWLHWQVGPTTMRLNSN